MQRPSVPFGILIVCTVWVAVSLSVAAEGLDLSLPPGASAALVQTAAERIVSAFAAQASESLGAPLAGGIPSVVVDSSANLVYFDHLNVRIVTSRWDTLDSSLRSFFVSLTSDGVPESASDLFTSLFNGFLIAHEMTHWLQRLCELDLELDRYASEVMANDLAVAFFMRFEGGGSELLSLRKMLELAVERLTDPTPAGEDPAAYFNTHYAELARDAARYGFYQFRFIIDSIDRRDHLDFHGLIRRMGRAPDESPP